MPHDSNEMLGWIPDLPDHRDHFVTFKSAEPEKQFVKKKEGSKARSSARCLEIYPFTTFAVYTVRT